MEANQWAQFEGVKGMEEIGHPCTSSRPISSSERKVRPQKDQVVNCPRCQSTNTKFCYYNNYSLTQPRYFCKTCRRYWTEGGTLRNVPVGGGSRKNRRSSSSSTTSSSSGISTLKKTPDSNPSHISQFSSQNPNKFHEGHDLNLANFPYGQQDQHHHYHFPPQIQLFEFPSYNESNTSGGGVTTMKPNPSSATTPFAALELLRNGFSTASTNSHHMTEGGQSSNSNGVMYNNVGFPFQDLKPSPPPPPTGLSFTVDHRYGNNNNRYNNIGSNGIQIMHDDQDEDNINEKVMFPLEASILKQNSGLDHDHGHGHGHGHGEDHGHHHNNNKVGQQQISNGCSSWNGMLGGGSW